MVTRIELRRDTAATWTAINPVLGLGEPGIETDTGRRKLGDGVTPWTALPHDGDLLAEDPALRGPVIDITSRSYGVHDDTTFDGSHIVGTDWTAAIADAAADCPRGGTLLFPPGRTIGLLPQTMKPITIAGANRKASRLIAPASTPAGTWMFNPTVDNSDPATYQSHAHGVTVRDLQLDGNGRGPDIGGVFFERQGEVILERVAIKHFARQGVAGNSWRESRISGLIVMYCGDSDRDMAAVDLDEYGANEGFNNLHFDDLKSIFNYGTQLRLRLTSTTQSPVRNNFFNNVMLHAATGGTFPGADDWATVYADDHRNRGGITLDIEHARTVYITNARFHATSYGQPLIRQKQLPALGSSTVNSLYLAQFEIGQSVTQTSAAATANPTTGVLTLAGHMMQTGARVQLTTTGTLPTGLATGTDYLVIRVDANTFKLATSINNAYAGTAVTFTDAGTGTHTVTSQDIAIVNDKGTLAMSNGVIEAHTRSVILNNSAASDVYLGSTVVNAGTPTLVEGNLPAVASNYYSATLGADAPLTASSTTLTNTALTISGIAAGTYLVNAEINYQTTSAADLNIGFTCTGGTVSGTWLPNGAATNATTAQASSVWVSRNFNGGAVVIGGVDGLQMAARPSGQITFTSTGTITLKAAQGTADATSGPTIFAGSWINLTKVG